MRRTAGTIRHPPSATRVRPTKSNSKRYKTVVVDVHSTCTRTHTSDIVTSTTNLFFFLFHRPKRYTYKTDFRPRRIDQISPIPSVNQGTTTYRINAVARVRVLSLFYMLACTRQSSGAAAAGVNGGDWCRRWKKK